MSVSSSFSKKCVTGMGALLFLFALSCDSEPVRVFNQEAITVACGSCVFEMEGVEGCPLAAEIDGEYYLVRGALPEHDSHEADGICNMKRSAIVDGELRGEFLVVSKIEFVPADSIPESPRFAPDEGH
jgi:hypothetical protein